MLYTSFESPIGELLAVGDAEALHGLYMQGVERRSPFEPTGNHQKRHSERYARSSRTTSPAGARCSICHS